MGDQKPDNDRPLEYLTPGPRTPEEVADVAHRQERSRNFERVTLALLIGVVCPILLYVLFFVYLYWRN